MLNKIKIDHSISRRFADLIQSVKGTNSEKFLFMFKDGQTVESVILYHENMTCICVSTQIGCPVGCIFCASGRNGFIRNLVPQEIIAQVFQTACLSQRGKILFALGPDVHSPESHVEKKRRLCKHQDCYWSEEAEKHSKELINFGKFFQREKHIGNHITENWGKSLKDTTNPDSLINLIEKNRRIDDQKKTTYLEILSSVSNQESHEIVPEWVEFKLKKEKFPRALVPEVQKRLLAFYLNACIEVMSLRFDHMTGGARFELSASSFQSLLKAIGIDDYIRRMPVPELIQLESSLEFKKIRSFFNDLIHGCRGYLSNALRFGNTYLKKRNRQSMIPQISLKLQKDSDLILYKLIKIKRAKLPVYYSISQDPKDLTHTLRKIKVLTNNNIEKTKIHILRSFASKLSDLSYTWKWFESSNKILKIYSN